MTARTGRLVAIAVVGLFLVLSVARLVALLTNDLWGFLGAFGVDYRFFMEAAHRLLSGGGFYLPHQLAGPYAVSFYPALDVMYPPPAALFFVAFAFLPVVLWWALPLGVLGYGFYRWRPRPWTWPILAFAFWWTPTWMAVIYGSTDLWVMAAITGGLLWGWSAPLVLLKPTLAPFAVVGLRRRSWWLGVGLLAVVSLLTLPLWADYLTAMRNADASANVTHSLWDLPLLLVPVIGWLGQQTSPDAVLLRRVADREDASGIGEVVNG